VKVRKIYGFLFLLVLIGGFVFAGGGQEEPAESAGPKKVELEMWIHDGASVKWFEQEAIIYNDLHPEINFSVKIENIPYAELVTKYITASATGDAKLMPDVIGVVDFHFPRLIKAGLLDNFVDIGAVLKEENIKPDEIINTDKWLYNGITYGTDWTSTLCVYYYNKEIMDKAGVDPTTFKTYDDFIAAGKKVKATTGAAMSVLDIAAWNQFQILAIQNGGGWFDDNGKVIMDSPETIEALTLYKRMLDEGIVEPVSQFYAAETFELYRQNQVAGAIMADWYGSFVMEPRVPEMSGKWRITALPAYREGESRTSQRGGTGFVIIKDSPEVDYAVDFYKHAYLTNESLLRNYKMNNYLPPLKEALADPSIINQEWEFYGGQKAAQVYLDIFDEMPTYYRGKYLLEAYDLINTQILPSVVKGEASPEEALKKAAIELRKITGE
jgi:ABC-type glycerol-3-phosphate transport system substrate-binding protein